MSAASSSTMVEVFNSLRERLAATDLSFTSTAYRDDALSLLVSEPGHYWEIDVLEDGSIDVEIYASQGLEDDPWGAVAALIARNRDNPPPERT